MLKSLFESSIDKLHIPADMKDAIKQINNICLEAEDTSDNVKKSVEKVSKNQGMFNQHVSAEQAKAMYDAQQKENAAKSGGKPQTQVAKNDEPNAQKGTTKLKNDIMPKLIKEYGKDDPIITKLNDAIKLINDPKTLKEGSAKLRKEVFAQIIEDQGNKAPILNDINDIIKIINTPDPKKEEPKAEEPKAEEAKAEEPAENEETKQAQNDEGATEANTASEAQPAQAEETNTAEAQPAQTEETKAAEEQPAQTEEAQPAQTTEGNATEPKAEEANAEAQPAQTEETKTAEEQPAQNAEPQENKGVQIAKGATREPSQVRTSGPASSEPNNGAANAEETQQAQNNEGSTEAAPAAEEQPAQAAEAPKPKLSFRPDVMTVQFYLQSIMPNSNLVADGLLGPKTISAIQQKEDIDVTGKMDGQTKQAFNMLLAEAKKKVIPMQEQLGIKADGLIGKQTLQAAKNANMNVTNAFSQNVKPTQQVASKKANVNVLDTPFDAAKANKDLANKQISQVEYNLWKSYGVSPEHQRNNPNEVRAQVSRLAKLSPSERRQQSRDVNVANSAQNTNNAQMPKEMKPTVGAGNDKNVAEVAASVKGPQNDAEKKFFNQTKENWTKVYAEKFKNNPERISPAADQQARIELMKYRARMAQAARKNGQQQGAQQQVAQQQGGQQVAANGNTTPAQKAAPKQKQGTQSYSGKVSYMHLPPDEKKVYDEAEKKYLDKNMKWGKNEQIALDQAALAASTAVLKYRAQKGGNQNG